MLAGFLRPSTPPAKATPKHCSELLCHHRICCHQHAQIKRWSHSSQRSWWRCVGSWWTHVQIMKLIDEAMSSPACRLLSVTASRLDAEVTQDRYRYRQSLYYLVKRETQQRNQHDQRQFCPVSLTSLAVQFYLDFCSKSGTLATGPTSCQCILALHRVTLGVTAKGA